MTMTSVAACNYTFVITSISQTARLWTRVYTYSDILLPLLCTFNHVNDVHILFFDVVT